MRHFQQLLLSNKNCFLITQFQIHDEVQDLCPVTWNIFHGNSNIKSRVYDNIFKIFPTRHLRTLPYWWAHCSRWICLHKSRQRHVWTETGSHNSLQPAYFEHGTTGLLCSALYNWTLVTKYQKKCFCLNMDDFGVNYFTKDDANHLLDSLKKHYAISIDWEDRNYFGLTIYWIYSEEYVEI